jgi:hypothetical protein
MNKRLLLLFFRKEDSSYALATKPTTSRNPLRRRALDDAAETERLGWRD